MIYLPCGDRRASVCPACAETYRADTYQLIRAGLAGGKGMPESVAVHPCVFATFTAPSFGPVHTRVTTPDGRVARCRPRRKASFCKHGSGSPAASGTRKPTPASAGRSAPTATTTAPRSSGTATHPNSGAAPSSPCAASSTRPPEPTAPASGSPTPKSPNTSGAASSTSTPSSGSTASTPSTRNEPRQPHPALTAGLLAGLIRQVAPTVWFATVPHPAKPSGWDIRWGAQVDPRIVAVASDGQITDVAVASYLAKYATKSTEAAGIPPGRITAENASIWTDKRTHQGRLIGACLKIGAHPHEDYRALRRWAHMLGYRGHFATKSRRYSTTMRALRAARRDWQRRQQPHAIQPDDPAVITETDLEWAGRGWRTSGDALLAMSAAARAREHRRAAREAVQSS